MAETTGIIYKSKLTAIGDAIRERTGETELINIDDMPEKILGIKGGVDNPLIAENDAQMEEYLNNAEYLGMFVKFTGNSSNYVSNEIYRIEETAGDIEQYMPVSELQNITTVKKLLDAKKSANNLFDHYSGTSVDGLIAYNDTENVTSMRSMFEECENLTSIPLLDTSKVTYMGYMFYYCRSLTEIPLLDTSNVTNMVGMFQNGSRFQSIPLLNTSKVTNMSSMFAGTSLTTIPLLDTSNVTNMSNMFSLCNPLTSIPLLDTSKVTNMEFMFYYCRSLTEIPALDFSALTDMEYAFYNCTSLTSFLATGMKVSFNLASTALEHDALVVVLNNLGTVTTTQTLTLGATKLALLSDDEKAIATNKGWTLA